MNDLLNLAQMDVSLSIQQSQGVIVITSPDEIISHKLKNPLLMFTQHTNVSRFNNSYVRGEASHVKFNSDINISESSDIGF